LTWAEIVIPRLPPPARQRRHVETIAEAVEFLLDHLLERLVDKVRRAEARAA
jgi:hypothetical protein